MPRNIPREAHEVRDANKRLIVPGSKVVFNLSGELSFGEVEFAQWRKEPQPEYYHNDRWLSYIQIRQVYVWKGEATRKAMVSKVKNPRGILIIDQFPGCHEEGPEDKEIE